MLLVGSLVLGGCSGADKMNETLEDGSQIDNMEGEVSIGGIEIESSNGGETMLPESQAGLPLAERPMSTEDMSKQVETKKGQSNVEYNIINVEGLKSPGIADALLTKDAMMGVIMELTVRGCNEYDSHKAYMLQDPVMETAKKGSWQERWIISACDNKYQIDLNFIETIGEGTDWTIVK
jgi:hypothetical protein